MLAIVRGVIDASSPMQVARAFLCLPTAQAFLVMYVFSDIDLYDLSKARDTLEATCSIFNKSRVLVLLPSSLI